MDESQFKLYFALIWILFAHIHNVLKCLFKQYIILNNSSLAKIWRDNISKPA